MNSIISTMRRSIKKWLNKVFYDKEFSKEFNQDMTPDSLILKSEIDNINDEILITRLLEQDVEDVRIKCCIKYPSKHQTDECLRKHHNTYCVEPVTEYKE